jgi:hypothetical protein
MEKTRPGHFSIEISRDMFPPINLSFEHVNVFKIINEEVIPHKNVNKEFR